MTKNTLAVLVLCIALSACSHRPLKHRPDFLQTPDPDSTAILFVHGWSGSEKSFGNLQALIQSSEEFKDRKFTSYTLRYWSKSLLPSFQGIRALGGRLAGALEEVREKNVIIVAHSMGGLVAREGILQYQEKYPEARKVEKLVMIGTPNYGTVMGSIHRWAWMPLSILALPVTVPGNLFDACPDGNCVNPTAQTRDLSKGSKYLLDLNRRWYEWERTSRKSLLPKVYTIAGYYDQLLGVLSTTDGVVETMSVHFPAESYAEEGSFDVPRGHTGDQVFVRQPSHPTYRILKAILTGAKTLKRPPSAPGYSGLWIELFDGAGAKPDRLSREAVTVAAFDSEQDEPHEDISVPLLHTLKHFEPDLDHVSRVWGDFFTHLPVVESFLHMTETVVDTNVLLIENKTEGWYDYSLKYRGSSLLAKMAHRVMRGPSGAFNFRVRVDPSLKKMKLDPEKKEIAIPLGGTWHVRFTLFKDKLSIEPVSPTEDPNRSAMEIAAKLKI